MKLLEQIRLLLEYMGGAIDDRPPGFPKQCDWLVTAAWWAFLVCLIAIFSGQASKFIYIDF